MTDRKNRPSGAARGPVARRIPAGDDRERLVCPDCGFVDYVNPRIVVGSVVAERERVLLCRRAIEPRKGFWTLPAGYLEEGETVEAGARREAMEEARADIALEQVLAIYSIPRISQVQIIFRAHLLRPQIAAGPESLEVGLFGWNDIPWDDIAFPSVHWALAHYRETLEENGFQPRGNPEGARGDMSGPSGGL